MLLPWGRRRGWNRPRPPSAGLVMRCAFRNRARTGRAQARASRRYVPRPATAIGVPGQGGQGFGHRRPVQGRRVSSSPPSAGITMHSRVSVCYAQEGQRAAIGRPHRRDVAGFTFGQLQRFAGGRLAHANMKGADLGTLARTGRCACHGAKMKGGLRTVAAESVAFLRGLRSGASRPVTVTRPPTEQRAGPTLPPGAEKIAETI